MQEKNYKYVRNLWNDAEVNKLDPAARLVYRSNKLGEDQRITNTGGGNTSSKLPEKDPLTGEVVEVLWVKGSGGDLRTSPTRTKPVPDSRRGITRCRSKLAAAAMRATSSSE